MYKQIYKIGDLSNRPMVENWTYSQDAGGGVQKTLDNAFYVWAKFEKYNGTFDSQYGKYNWIYGMKMITRIDSLIKSSSTVVYDNYRWSVKSVITIDSRFCEIILEKSENQLVSGNILPPMANSYFYNYEATGGETTIVNASLIGKTVFGVYKDGAAKAILISGSPANDEVVYDSATGTFTFGMPFYQDEKAIIQYF